MSANALQRSSREGDQFMGDFRPEQACGERPGRFRWKAGEDVERKLEELHGRRLPLWRVRRPASQPRLPACPRRLPLLRAVDIFGWISMAAFGEQYSASATPAPSKVTSLGGSSSTANNSSSGEQRRFAWTIVAERRPRLPPTPTTRPWARFTRDS